MGIDKNNLQDIIKAPRCLGSQSCTGDCYADFYNLHNYENEVANILEGKVKINE